jgi:hypothetical protein
MPDFTFAWISAFVAHYLAKDGPIAFIPFDLTAAPRRLLCDAASNSPMAGKNHDGLNPNWFYHVGLNRQFDR